MARYAQACNLFAAPDLEHKLDVLRGHCEAEGRDYDEIEKTVMLPLDAGENGEKVEDLLVQLRGLAALGVGEVHGWVPRVWQTERLGLLGKEIVAAAAEF